MSDNLQRQAEEVFHAALGLPVVERAAFLDARCGDDSELRSEVRSLLDAWGDATAFMRSPWQENDVTTIIGTGAAPFQSSRKNIGLTID